MTKNLLLSVFSLLFLIGMSVSCESNNEEKDAECCEHHEGEHDGHHKECDHACCEDGKHKDCDDEACDTNYHHKHKSSCCRDGEEMEGNSDEVEEREEEASPAENAPHAGSSIE